jgi:coenzyme F420-reducing hydrogenase gamma subunit
VARRKKPRLAVWKFASCDGCQLTLLDCEDELLPLDEVVEIAYFKEATRAESRGPFDLSLVDGSITTAADAERIREVRRRSRRLVSIGACATAGGIQALRNFRDVRAFIEAAYARPDYIDTLATSTAIADHVPVDFELRGCPIDRRQLLEVIAAFTFNGGEGGPRPPAVPSHSVCVDCKLRGNPCVLVLGTPCLGPITHAGCGALCPTYGRGCYGCFGPSETTQIDSLERGLRARGVDEEGLWRALRTFNANAPALRDASRALEAEAVRGARGPVEPRLLKLGPPGPRSPGATGAKRE